MDEEESASVYVACDGRVPDRSNGSAGAPVRTPPPRPPRRMKSRASHDVPAYISQEDKPGSQECTASPQTRTSSTNGQDREYTEDHYEEGGDGSYFNAPPKISPSKSSTRSIVPSSGSKRLSERPNSQLACYWGGISRIETDEKLRNHADGAYLIRDSTTPGTFTLTVRHCGQNKCLKIYGSPEGKFGLKMSECCFDSLSALINHYTDNSLAEFNKQLTTHLVYPVSKLPMGKVNLYESLALLAVKGRSLRKAQHMYLELLQQHEKASQQVELAQLKMRALETARDMYYAMLEPSQTQDDLEEIEGLGETQALMWRNNSTTILKRHVNFVEQVASAEKAVEACEERQTLTKHDLNSLMESLYDQEEECATIREQVMACGAIPDLVDCLLDYDSLTPSWDPRCWKMMNFNREEAEARLADRDVGTFLIRPRNDVTKPYALSVVCRNDDGSKEVKHCQICHPRGRGFGFTVDGAVFESVEELVARHVDISIKMYFSNIDTPLAYPVLAEEGADRDTFMSNKQLLNRT